MTDHKKRVLYVVVCAAGPAAEVGQLVSLAQRRGWDVQVIATPAAMEFIDVSGLEALTGRPVRSTYRKPNEPRSPRADAIVVAPGTYNTINKFATGVSDTYALGVLAEAPGLGIPVVMLPFVNSALANREAFRRSVIDLTREGVRILLGAGSLKPHAPGSGAEHLSDFPWELALSEVEALCSAVHP